MAKQYLGDGIYVDFDGYALWLTAEDGTQVINMINTICLEPEVYAALVRYVDELKQASANAMRRV